MVPAVHQDERGEFVEWYRASEVAAAAGYEMSVAQANLSVSRRGVVRGIHFVHLPPGQVKYVTCVAGSVLDVVVDLRVGSPTYRCFDAVTSPPNASRTATACRSRASRYRVVRSPGAPTRVKRLQNPHRTSQNGMCA